MTLTSIDWLLMFVYFAFVLGVGFTLKRYTRTSKDFFLAGRALPAWVCGLAFISANLGAQEIIGMAASGAKYGIATSHFYWIGAIPAMVFLGIFMMPYYYGSRARSVPEYLRLRFDEKTRGFNAISFALMTVFSSGISMYAMAKLLQILHIFDAPFRALGLPPTYLFHVSIVASAIIVLLYVFAGGLSSAIYNEVLQFFLIVAGFVPLVYLGLKDVGGWSGLRATLPTAMMHSWHGMARPETNPMGVDVFGVAMGLGFVLSFGYWCTDFLVVQRAMAADSMTAARRTPLIAAVPKSLFPFLVIMPGLIALAAHPTARATLQTTPGYAGAASISAETTTGAGLIPYKVSDTTGEIVRDQNGRPQLDYDLAVPVMLLHYFPAGLLGLGLTALLASFMSGMAGNVTAFNTVWTYDIYQAYIRPKAPDAHYLWMGRMATIFGIAASVATAYVAAQFNNIMDILQLVFAFVNAPLLATFLLGMFWKRTTGHGAFAGLLCGTAAAAVHHMSTLAEGAAPGIKGGLITVAHTYYSEMAQNFWTAIVAWTVCFVVTIAVSLATRPHPEDSLRGLVYSLTERPRDTAAAWYARPSVLAVGVLALTALLNVVFF
ncbi:MAG TPA: sodium:solute symporter family protein [Vicinamibacterales bacterium]|jgi:SSS family solute:Na+ symporter|nr:sodium:solute symporter family protein [Vicinamibacterales bacterium]